MNFLEIVKKANIFSGLQGEIDSVLSVRGLQKTLVEFVKTAYIDIQNVSESWSWRYKSVIIPWNSSSTLHIDSTVEKWTKLFYDGGNLKFIEYEDWIMDPPTTASVPQSFTIVPESNGIIINPVGSAMLVNARAYRAIDELSTNAQIPIIPTGYQMIIAYKAAIDMADLLGNYDIFQLNTGKYDVLLGQLKRRSLLPLKIKQRPFV